MHTTNFQTREVGPGLSSHSKQLTHNINIHIIAPSQFSLDELLKVELKREIFIEIDGLNDRRCEPHGPQEPGDTCPLQFLTGTWKPWLSGFLI